MGTLQRTRKNYFSGWIQIKSSTDRDYHKYFAKLCGRELWFFTSKTNTNIQQIEDKILLSQVECVTMRDENKLLGRVMSPPLVALEFKSTLKTKNLKITTEKEEELFQWYRYLHTLALLRPPDEAEKVLPGQKQELTDIITDESAEAPTYEEACFFDSPTRPPSVSQNPTEEQIYIAMKPVFLGGRITEELEAPPLPERQARNLVLDRPPVPIPSTEDNQSNPRYAPFHHRNSMPVISTRTELFSEQPPTQEFSPIEENPTNPEIGIVEPKIPKPLSLHPKLPDDKRRKSESAVFQSGEFPPLPPRSPRAPPFSAQPPTFSWFINRPLQRIEAEKILDQNVKYGNMILRIRSRNGDNDSWTHSVSIRLTDPRLHYKHYLVKETDDRSGYVINLEDKRGRVPIETLQGVIEYFQKESSGKFVPIKNTVVQNEHLYEDSIGYPRQKPQGDAND